MTVRTNRAYEPPEPGDGTRDTDHDNAVALRDHLRERRGPRGDTQDEGSEAPT